MRIETLDINSVHPSAYNPRIALDKNSRDYRHIRESIEQYGFVEPIVVNAETRACIGGHQRLAVLKDLGYTTVEAVLVDIEDPQKEKALCLALNRIKGEWDMGKLAELLSDEKIAALETGFEEGEIDLSRYLGDDDTAGSPDDEEEYDPDAEGDFEPGDGEEEGEDTEYNDADEGVPETSGVCYFDTYRWKIPVEKYRALMEEVRSQGLFEKDDITKEFIRRVKSD